MFIKNNLHGGMSYDEATATTDGPSGCYGATDTQVGDPADSHKYKIILIIYFLGE